VIKGHNKNFSTAFPKQETNNTLKGCKPSVKWLNIIHQPTIREFPDRGKDLSCQSTKKFGLVQKYFFFLKNPSLQFVDNCTNGTITYSPHIKILQATLIKMDIGSNFGFHNPYQAQR
jgi:hypothetical protein